MLGGSGSRERDPGAEPGQRHPVLAYGALALRELELGELQRPFDFTTGLDRIGFEMLIVVG
jgi:hypothetical protein